MKASLNTIQQISINSIQGGTVHAPGIWWDLQSERHTFLLPDSNLCFWFKWICTFHTNPFDPYKIGTTLQLCFKAHSQTETEIIIIIISSATTNVITSTHVINKHGKHGCGPMTGRISDRAGHIAIHNNIHNQPLSIKVWTEQNPHRISPRFIIISPVLRYLPLLRFDCVNVGLGELTVPTLWLYLAPFLFSVENVRVAAKTRGNWFIQHIHKP